MKIRTPSLKRSLLSLIAVTVLVGISSPANGVLFATASAASTPALGSPTSASSHTTGSTSIDPRVAAALKWSAPDQVDTSLPFTDSLTYTPYSYPVGTSTVAQPCWPTNVSSGSCTSRNAIACPTTTLCLVANGQNILASTDPSGKASSWFVLHNALGTADPVETGTTYTLDSSDTITSIACNPSTPILCVAVDTSGDAFVDESVTNGAWAISPTGPWTTETSSQTVGTFDGIACPCNVPIDTIKQQSGTLSYGTPVNCTAASPCWIPNALTSVSCPTASTCVATDQSGYILDTIGLQNNGSSPTMPAWTVESISQTTGFFLGASCAAAAPCLLPVDDIVQTTGTSYGLSCAALTPCYLPTSINAIACPQITQCLIVDSQGNLFISSNPTSSASWGASIPVDRPTFVPVPIVAIACPSSSLCIAGDVNGNLLTSVSPQTASASSWVLTSQDSGNSIQAIYCPSITACYVADNKGNVLHGTS
ncbi:MAG TPA: hypothetical protein VMU77_08205, partial [Acidimicrobiales bacterium]|nr:hypothetical protein [Acidimicrobiales bacterium]